MLHPPQSLHTCSSLPNSASVAASYLGETQPENIQKKDRTIRGVRVRVIARARVKARAIARARHGAEYPIQVNDGT